MLAPWVIALIAAALVVVGGVVGGITVYIMDKKLMSNRKKVQSLYRHGCINGSESLVADNTFSQLTQEELKILQRIACSDGLAISLNLPDPSLRLPIAAYMAGQGWGNLSRSTQSLYNSSSTQFFGGNKPYASTTTMGWKAGSTQLGRKSNDAGPHPLTRGIHSEQTSTVASTTHQGGIGMSKETMLTHGARNKTTHTVQENENVHEHSIDMVNYNNPLATPKTIFTPSDSSEFVFVPSSPSFSSTNEYLTSETISKPNMSININGSTLKSGQQYPPCSSTLTFSNVNSLRRFSIDSDLAAKANRDPIHCPKHTVPVAAN